MIIDIPPWTCIHTIIYDEHDNGLVQNCRLNFDNALQIAQSWTELSIWTMQALHARKFGRYWFSVVLFTLNIASQSLSAKQVGRNHFYGPLLLLAT